MSNEHLKQEDAFSTGSELWVLPDRNHSHWCRRLDWHLQFQISRIMLHKTPDLSDNLKSLASQAEITLIEKRWPKSSPILILSPNLLPNKYTIHLSYPEDFKAWIQQIVEIHSRLKPKSLRIFLPLNVKSQEFTKVWPLKETELTFIEDLEN